MAIPKVPPIRCPDCPGVMLLRPMPENWHGGPNKPWVYLCQNYPACRGLLGAHPDGRPVGAAVPQEVRTARRHCHAVFDPLWKTAPQHYEIQEHREADVKKAAAKIRKAARNRAYAYIAAKLGMDQDACHIGRITDLPTLRRFYREARAATYPMIRAWVKSRSPEKG